MRRMGLVGILVAACIVGGVLAQDAGSVVGGDDAALRAFISRYVGGQGGPAPVDVIVAGLPDLGFDLSTPPGTTLVGSIVRPDSIVQGLTFYEILLENPILPADVLAFYTQTLPAQGWQLIYSDDSAAGGFVESSFVAASFCSSDAAVSLSFDALTNAQSVGRTLINMRIQTPADPFQCQPPDQPVVDVTFTLIPSLRMPEGVTMISNIGGGLSYYAADARSASVTAIMMATLTLSQLADAYNTQLIEAGWTLISQDTTERSALSTWTITASDGSVWRGGLLLLADLVAPGQFNAMLWVEE